jgi:hypothetical protein
MPAEHEIAAPALLARTGGVSPWRISARRPAPARRWLAWLVSAWREGLALYAQAAMLRGDRGWF